MQLICKVKFRNNNIILSFKCHKSKFKYIVMNINLVCFSSKILYIFNLSNISFLIYFLTLKNLKI